MAYYYELNIIKQDKHLLYYCEFQNPVIGQPKIDDGKSTLSELTKEVYERRFKAAKERP